jgi:hypothetical protein
MATLREFLNQKEFDWTSGTVLIQWTKPEDSVFEDEVFSRPGWDSTYGASFILPTNPILDKEFSDDYGSPQCPRFIAEDKDFVYFPGTYDGATWCVKIYKEIDHYLDWENNESPYVGGG